MAALQADAPRTAVPPSNATLVSRVAFGGHLVILGVASDAGPLDFTPGQFVNLGLADAGGTWIRRPYSIASAPGARVTEFAITRVEGGALSPELGALPLGSRLFMETVAAGSFTLRDVPAGADLLLVATGTGTAPFLGMMRGGQWEGRRVTVVHGARVTDGLAYARELGEAPGVRYLPTVTRDGAWAGRKGRVQAVLDEIRPDAGCTHALVCGNPEMTHEVRAQLEAVGFRKHRRREPGNLHVEAYW